MDKFELYINTKFNMTTKMFTSVFSDTRLSQVKEAFEVGQQSRQAELDEKDKRIEMCKALFMNYYNGGSDTDDLLDDLEKALRGE